MKSKYVAPVLTAVLAAVLASAQANAQCVGDSECKGGRRCMQGKCVAPSATTSCGKDTDCPGDAVCERGTCTLPAQATPAPVPSPPPSPPAAQPAPATQPPASAAPAQPPPVAPLPSTPSTAPPPPGARPGPIPPTRVPVAAAAPAKPASPKPGARHSTGMVAGGSVMVGLGGTLGIASAPLMMLPVVGAPLAVTANLLIGAGVPLIIIGSTRAGPRAPGDHGSGGVAPTQTVRLGPAGAELTLRF